VNVQHGDNLAMARFLELASRSADWHAEESAYSSRRDGGKIIVNPIDDVLREISVIFAPFCEVCRRREVLETPVKIRPRAARQDAPSGAVVHFFNSRLQWYR
jgi:hypothetical protein